MTDFKSLVKNRIKHSIRKITANMLKPGAKFMWHCKASRADIKRSDNVFVKIEIILVRNAIVSFSWANPHTKYMWVRDSRPINEILPWLKCFILNNKVKS